MFAFARSVGTAMLEAPAAHCLGGMEGNNKTQKTEYCGFLKSNVPRQFTYFFNLSYSSYICFNPKILNCNRENLERMGLFHLGWNQNIDLLPQGGRTLKDSPCSRNLAENILTTSYFDSSLSNLMSLTPPKEWFLRALHCKLSALKSVYQSLFSIEPNLRP